MIDRNIKECLIRDGIIPEKETDGNEVDQPQENTKDSNSKQNTKMEDFISRFMVVAFVENDTLRYDTVTYKHMKYKLLSKENTIIGNAICKKPPIQLFIDNNKTEIKDSIICFKKKMYLCLIGFSKLAQEYLLQIFENCYFTIQDNQEWALQVHVYNWKLQEKIQFLDRCPFFKEQEMIEWEKKPFEMGDELIAKQPIVDGSKITFKVKRVGRYNSYGAHVLLQQFMSYMSRPEFPGKIDRYTCAQRQIQKD